MTLGAVMSAEMAEQPDRLAVFLSGADEVIGRVREVLPDPLAGTVLVARGSSDHAATTGRYLLELATRRVASASPSLYTMYGAQTDFTGYLVVAVSQSGRTPGDRAIAAGGPRRWREHRRGHQRRGERAGLGGGAVPLPGCGDGAGGAGDQNGHR